MTETKKIRKYDGTKVEESIKSTLEVLLLLHTHTHTNWVCPWLRFFGRKEQKVNNLSAQGQSFDYLLITLLSTLLIKFVYA